MLGALGRWACAVTASHSKDLGSTFQTRLPGGEEETTLVFQLTSSTGRLGVLAALGRGQDTCPGSFLQLEAISRARL